jgi:L-iditol 2-dehydrogenase
MLLLSIAFWFYCAEVQLRMQHVGICGTDLQIFDNGYLGEHDVTQPLAIGHESAGIISKLGEGVTSFKVGMS